ncbi:hypothetical protein STAQ_44460 [Allostella sp. ATCC 35155]|nr:hypothetical protein STAQ_44460 [Stella sp. ATCC 35155]
MNHARSTALLTIRASQDAIDAIDAIATATHRTRDDVVDQALRQYLELNIAQLQRIEEGLAAAREGRVRPADDVLDEIAAKHGWKR